jgi:hypothetical protein
MREGSKGSPPVRAQSSKQVKNKIWAQEQTSIY